MQQYPDDSQIFKVYIFDNFFDVTLYLESFSTFAWNDSLSSYCYLLVCFNQPRALNIAVDLKVMERRYLVWCMKFKISCQILMYKSKIQGSVKYFLCEQFWQRRSNKKIILYFTFVCLTFLFLMLLFFYQFCYVCCQKVFNIITIPRSRNKILFKKDFL